MENQKDIEALKYSLSLKLEIFNKIRYGYEALIKEETQSNDVDNSLVTEENKVINTSEKSLEKELVLVDEKVEEFKEESKNTSERKSTMNISNLGTSYFGRRRR